MGLFDKFKKKDTPQVETKLVPGVGRMPYPAYRGTEPYIFVSYAHADSEIVFNEIRRFNEEGYHVWYDEGIAPGNEWTEEIAEALEKCTVFVVMLTPTSAPRENVLNEVYYALDEKKPFIAIHLEETVLPAGLRLRIGSKQAILKYKMSEEEYLFKLVGAFDRFGLVRSKVKPVIQKPAEPAPTEQTPTEPAKYELSQEARQRIERTMESDVRAVDFEWIGSTLKGFHGIQKRVVVPSRASKIMSHAFSGLPMEYVRLHKGITELDFAAFNKCAELKQAVIECPEIKINNIEDSVSPIGAFCQCPKVIVYCHKDSATYEELKRTHNGEIRFIEDMTD